MSDNELPSVKPPLEKLVRAVLLFHGGGEWTSLKQREWYRLTGETDATTTVLCRFARRLLMEIETKSDE